MLTVGGEEEKNRNDVTPPSPRQCVVNPSGQDDTNPRLTPLIAPPREDTPRYRDSGSRRLR